MPFDLYLHQVLASIYASASYIQPSTVFDRLEMEGVDLTDIDWRDENIELLPEWHPYFYLICDDLRFLLVFYARVMMNYRDFFYSLQDTKIIFREIIGNKEDIRFVFEKLEPSSENVDEFYNHVLHEVQQWLLIQMEYITKIIWDRQDFID